MPRCCRAGLSKGLAQTARKWASTVAEEEADRLTPLVLSLSERCAPPSTLQMLKNPTPCAAQRERFPQAHVFSSGYCTAEVY